jgi:SAM-dependent methyltransferase
MTAPDRPEPSETALASLWVKQHAEAWKSAPATNELNEMLRRLGRWRSRLLANTFVARHGPRVLAGPFAGMEYLTKASEGALMPRLLGAYESELHPHLAAFAQQGLDCVIDVGCAEGYYAVGLARMMPATTVYAYDIDPIARAACADLAARNGVADRVVVGGEFAPEGFQAFAGRRALVMVDAEGFEDDLLFPDRSPALAAMRLIVETHDLYKPGVRARLVERFSPTHDIVTVHQQLKAFPLPEWLTQLGHLDQLLAVWEWRAAATPWLVMTPKS